MKKILSGILPILAVLIALFLIFPNDKNKYDLSIVDNENATIVVSDSNNNSVKIGKESLIESEEYSVTINVVEGYELTQIKLNNEIIDLQSTFTFVATSNVVIEVDCSQIVVGDFNLSIICMHADISVVDSNNNSIDNGTNVLFENEEYTVTIDIHNAYDFWQIRVNGEVIPLANPFTFVAVADTIIIIDTSPIAYIPPTEDGGITVNPTPEETTYNISSIELPAGVDAVMHYGENLSKYTNDLDFILNYDFAENEEFKIDLVNNNNMAMKYQLNDGEMSPYFNALELVADGNHSLVVEECQPSLCIDNSLDGVNIKYYKSGETTLYEGLPTGKGTYYLVFESDNPYFKFTIDGSPNQYLKSIPNTEAVGYSITLSNAHKVIDFTTIDTSELTTCVFKIDDYTNAIGDSLSIKLVYNGIFIDDVHADSEFTIYHQLQYYLIVENTSYNRYNMYFMGKDSNGAQSSSQGSGYVEYESTELVDFSANWKTFVTVTLNIDILEDWMY